VKVAVFVSFPLTARVVGVVSALRTVRRALLDVTTSVSPFFVLVITTLKSALLYPLVAVKEYVAVVAPDIAVKLGTAVVDSNH